MRRTAWTSNTVSDVTQNRNKSYEGAFDGNLGFGYKPALILVDFVEAYFDKASPLYAGVEDALASALRIRDAARAVGIPVFYSNVVYQKGGTDGGVFYRKVPALEVFVEGNPLGNWPAGLEPVRVAVPEQIVGAVRVGCGHGNQRCGEHEHAITQRSNMLESLLFINLTHDGPVQALQSQRAIGRQYVDSPIIRKYLCAGISLQRGD